ncbi:MAG: tRNA preQ1(34) S-adenosylmethionine ribosyltransferase-isomerase QueA, partial [Bacteroidia bacterium]|nr:tRNA preQ1(34) S-adenosylmethionine ribosyltransferase-isomerase QueA [Bacteroidia bacterium]
MKLSEFDLPQDYRSRIHVAQYPVYPRDASRMMVLHRATGEIEHRQFKDILHYFSEGDVIVLNDAKVFPAKLLGNKEKTGAHIEVFLLRELNKDSRLWDVVVDPARKIRVGNKLFFGHANGGDSELVAEVVDNTTSRGRTIRFLFDGTDEEFEATIDRLGLTPLPDYITREIEPEDRERYQTVFASRKGAVSAPESALHFTRDILLRLELQGVERTFVNLNIGRSFRDVEVEDLSKHKMDSENFEISPETANLVNEAKAKKKRVLAVGASVMRALESSVSASKTLNPGKGWTDRFIFPPYDFHIANAYLTNFQLPKSTSMMLSAAFA